MRIIGLLGSIAMLILPFSYISISGTFIDTTAWYGFLFASGDTSIFGATFSDSSTFSVDWITEDTGHYHIYFDPLFFLGLIVFGLLIVNIGLSIFASRDNMENLPGIILIVSGILLLVIRFTALDDARLSFYDDNSLFGTYLEIPLGFLYGLIFGIIEMKK